MTDTFTAWLLANKAWNDFPVVFLIVAIFVIVGWAGRWFWQDYKREAETTRAYNADQAEKDRLFREAQNEKRESAQDRRDDKWQIQIREQYRLYNQYDRERQQTLVKISEALENVATKTDLQEHDNRAKEIAGTIKRVEENTRPAPGTPGYERRHEGGD